MFSIYIEDDYWALIRASFDSIFVRLTWFKLTWAISQIINGKFLVLWLLIFLIITSLKIAWEDYVAFIIKFWLSN